MSSPAPTSASSACFLNKVWSFETQGSQLQASTPGTPVSTHHPATGDSRPRLGNSIGDADRDWGFPALLDPHSSPGPIRLPHSLRTDQEQQLHHRVWPQRLKRARVPKPSSEG